MHLTISRFILLMAMPIAIMVALSSGLHLSRALPGLCLLAFMGGIAWVTREKTPKL